MQIRGLSYLVLSAVLCLGITGCSHKNKAHGRDGYGSAATRGAGDQAGFDSEDQARDLLAKRKFYFAFDRSEIQDGDYDAIQAHAEFMKDHPNTHIRVEGHTDEQGSREYNVGLGERRARAVANALVSQGVSGSQISAVSYGKEKPESDGHDEEAYRLNRRAVVVYEER